MKILEESNVIIKLHKVSEKMPTQKGIRQGNTISVEVFKNLEWEEAGIQINEEYLNYLRFGDDIILMNYSRLFWSCTEKFRK